MRATLLALAAVFQIYSLPAGADDIRLSPFLITWDLLQQLAWKQWAVRFPLELAKWGQKVTSDGSAILVNGSGDPKMKMDVISVLNDTKTARLTELGFYNMAGKIMFKTSIRTDGHDLKPFDVNKIRQGILPFAISDPNEETMDLRMWIVDQIRFRFHQSQEIQGENRFIKGRTLSADDMPYMSYYESITPHKRFFRYDIDNESRWLKAAVRSMMVVKTVSPGQLHGNEEYYLNENPTDAKSFRDAFDSSITAWVVNGFQPGIASLLILLQYPDGQFY